MTNKKHTHEFIPVIILNYKRLSEEYQYDKTVAWETCIEHSCGKLRVNPYELKS